jgi:hypothetical protein
VTIRELWRRVFGEPEYVVQLRNLCEADALRYRLDHEQLQARMDEERDRGADYLRRTMIAFEERLEDERRLFAEELAELRESRDYYRQRMERYELLIHPGLVPRDPKQVKPPVAVSTGPRRKTWAQIQTEHAAEEFDPEKVKTYEEQQKQKREEIATKAQAAIDKAKADRARKISGAVEPQQEDTARTESTDVQS